MSESSPLRSVCAAKIDTFFLVAVQRPFEAGDTGFEMLNWVAQDVQTLSDGSQVFIYDRKNFGDASPEQETGLKEYLEDMVEEVGSVALYPTVRAFRGKA